MDASLKDSEFCQKIRSVAQLYRMDAAMLSDCDPLLFDDFGYIDELPSGPAWPASDPIDAVSLIEELPSAVLFCSLLLPVKQARFYFLDCMALISASLSGQPTVRRIWLLASPLSGSLTMLRLPLNITGKSPPAEPNSGWSFRRKK